MKDPQAAVLKYLTDQNRPYSANDIVLNTHKEHGKTAVQKALDNLVSEGKVVEKINGKQKAYVVDQRSVPTATEEELRALDEKFKAAEAELKLVNDQVKEVEGKLKILTSKPTNEEAHDEVDGLEKEVKNLESRLKTIKEAKDKGDGAGLISKKDKDKLLKDHEAAVKEWRKRKRMCSNIMEAILEGYPKPKKVFLEDVGIETDEEVGAKIPDI